MAYFPGYTIVSGTKSRIHYNITTTFTQRSWVRVPPGPLSSNNLEQVIYTHGAQANSAFHPFGVGK